MIVIYCVYCFNEAYTNCCLANIYISLNPFDCPYVTGLAGNSFVILNYPHEKTINGDVRQTYNDVIFYQFDQ